MCHLVIKPREYQLNAWSEHIQVCEKQNHTNRIQIYAAARTGPYYMGRSGMAVDGGGVGVCRCVLQVHDELVYEVSAEYASAVAVELTAPRAPSVASHGSPTASPPKMMPPDSGELQKTTCPMPRRLSSKIAGVTGRSTAGVQ